MNDVTNFWQERKRNACLVLPDGTVIKAFGIGAQATKIGELCFNTSITGYQEILTDPSYSNQIINFTFPHIGNVGTNNLDIEDYNCEVTLGAIGAIFKGEITTPSNYRSINHLNNWLIERNITAIYGVDTRAITHYIRKHKAPNVAIAYNEDGLFDYKQLHEQLKQWSGLNGLDLAKEASITQSKLWNEANWCWKAHSYQQNNETEPKFNIVVIDYGVKRNILRLLCNLDAKITVVPAQTSARDILALEPSGIFLSNGPGDPAATGQYAIDILKELFNYNIPIFGICLGHQLLALASGANTIKMAQGHRGANHPVKNLNTGKVEIVCMNHGFAVDSNSLPNFVHETHISLFDNSNCGLEFIDKPIFSVQYHPESSPGPQDSRYLFNKFKDAMLTYKEKRAS